MEEDGTEPWPGIIAGQGRRETPKTGEDGGGWYRTLTWHPSWTREKKKQLMFVTTRTWYTLPARVDNGSRQRSYASCLLSLCQQSLPQFPARNVNDLFWTLLTLYIFKHVRHNLVRTHAKTALTPLRVSSFYANYSNDYCRNSCC